MYLPEVLIILLNRTRNSNGKVEKDCRSVAFPSVSYSTSSDLMRFQLIFLLISFLFSQELDIGNYCNASVVSTKYQVRGAIFHDGEEVISGMSFLMWSMLCTVHDLNSSVFS